MEKLLSIDLKADFGMLKKPDTNEPVYLTFNMLHKPALLGILGAIVGFSGFKKHGIFPEYMERLKDLKVGISPLETEKKKFHENGNFSKTIIQYNNSTGLASDEAGGNLIVTEQTLVSPAYRCYVLLDDSKKDHNKLLNNLYSYKAEFLPYLGKNEFSIWWEDTKESQYNLYKPDKSFRIESLFVKSDSLKKNTQEVWFDFDMEEPKENNFLYLENLPIGYLGKPLFQYDYKEFAFTNFKLNKDFMLLKKYPLYKLDNNEIIQLF